MSVLHRIAVLVVALAAFPPLARAHDGPHAGSAVMGTIVSVSDAELVVKSEGKDGRITLTPRTKVVAGSRAVGMEALHPGTQVDVHGSKPPGGGFSAREVVIEEAETGPSPPNPAER